MKKKERNERVLTSQINLEFKVENNFDLDEMVERGGGIIYT